MTNPVNDLRLAFSREGKRWTGARETVLSVLEKSTLPLSAKDIFKKVRSSRVNLASIYRATDLLIERGIAVKAESLDGVCRYELSDRYRPHHHHVVCRDCGATKDVIGCGVKKIEERAFQLTGFKILEHRLSLIGLCPRCA